jgi:hypothetical protein
VSVRVSVGPVIVPVYHGRFRHPVRQETADRALHQWFTRFLAVIRLVEGSNGVQGVAGSNPAVPTDQALQLSKLEGLFSTQRLKSDGQVQRAREAGTRSATKSSDRTVGSSRGGNEPTRDAATMVTAERAWCDWGSGLSS